VKLYDFSIYAQRRAERKAAQAVAEAVADINRPGSVAGIKDKVNRWLDLHREVLKRTA
jgi:hypothetical protein